MRLKEFDALKWFAMFLVVWAHYIITLHPYWSETQWLVHDKDWLVRLIYSFHMPLFMCVSGFFAANIGKLRFVKMLGKKSLQILLPFFTACSIAFVLSYIVNGHVVGRLSSCWLFGYWFLKSLFTCCLVFWLSTAWGKKSAVVLLIITVTGSQMAEELTKILPSGISTMWALMQMNKMYPAFVVGAIIRWNFEWLKRNSLKVIICCLSGIAFSLLPPPEISDKLTMLRSLFTTIAVVFLFVWCSRFIKGNKFTEYICGVGMLTLGIYILDGFLSTNYVPRLIKIPPMNIEVFHFAVCLPIALIEMWLCALIVKWMEGNRIWGLLLLGKFQKNKKESTETAPQIET